MLLFAFPPHERLGRTIARTLRARLGRIERRVFSDGERYVRPVTLVRPPSRAAGKASGDARPKASDGQGGEDVVIIANTGPDAGAFLDLLIFLHALRSNGTRSITLVIPYLAYARQDQPDQPQAPVTIQLLAALLEAAGATSVILVDPHSPVAVRSFRVPVEVVDPLPSFVRTAVQHRVLANRKHPVLNRALIIVAPDAGARDRAQHLARLLNARDVIVLRKGRPRPNVARVAALTSADRRRVANRPAILADDMIDTAGTITAAARRLRAAGASRITIFATHAVLSGPAISRLRRARIDQIIVSDSLPFTRKNIAKQNLGGLPVRVVSIAEELIRHIRAVHKRRP